jgi:hypothetical protein
MFGDLLTVEWHQMYSLQNQQTLDFQDYHEQHHRLY